MNALLVGVGRQEVESLSQIRDTYLELADHVGHIIDLLIQGIAVTAKTTGDILMTQYGIEEGSDDGSSSEDDNDQDV